MTEAATTADWQLAYSKVWVVAVDVVPLTVTLLVLGFRSFRLGEPNPM